MKVSIKLEYKNKVYNSDYKEITEEEKNQLTDFIKKIVEGNATHLAFKKDNQEYYFGKEILKESIITITDTAY